MKKNIIILGIFLAVLGGCAEKPQIKTESRIIYGQSESQNNGGLPEVQFPLHLPEGFRITELTDKVPGARVLIGPDKLGNYWLSRTKQGIVSSLKMAEDGSVMQITDVFSGLDNPHGLALDPADGLTLYIAETDKVSRVRPYAEGSMEKLVTLPGGGRHYTRTLLFGKDGRLYISIGSSCDVCIERDERRAAIYVMEKDGKDFKSYVTGMRNAVFMTNEPVYGEIWVTEMGRDGLGDDLPPDEINIIAEGKDYGWPYCYGNQVRDMDFRPKSDQDYCPDTIPAKIELQAHSAPLGLAFVPEEGWPEDMRLDLIVAYHGSWDRSEPVGYSLVRFKLDDQRNVIGSEDFISGWLTAEGEKLGRPVDILIQPGGIMYITDDKRGAIYKVTYAE